MIDGLVITDNKALFEEFNMNFSSEWNNFEYTDSTDSAKEMIELELPDYLIIIEKSVKNTQKILNELHEKDEIKKIPVICFISASDWSQRNILWEANVKDIIQLPILKEEFKHQLERFIHSISDLSFDTEEVGMHGKLEDYNLIDLIQTLENNKKTGILNLYRSRDEGKIWFYYGNIQDVKYRTFQPLPAILKLITWMDGDFSITFVDEKYEKIIEEDNQQILLEAIQHIDQRNKILDTLPDYNRILLISPEADMDRMDEDDVSYFRFFHGGQTISAYLDAFDQDDITLLEKVQPFVTDKLLMTREEFDSHETEQEREVDRAGIKKVFKKFFKRREDEEGSSGSTSIDDGEFEMEKDSDLNEVNDKKSEILFQMSNSELKKLKDKLAKI